MSFRTAALLVALAVVVIASPVHAAEAAAEAFHDWRAECSDGNLCLLSNHAIGPNNEDVVLTLRRTADADADWQIIVMPISPPADLIHPFALQIDDGPKLTFNPGYDFLSYVAADNLFLVNPGLAGRLMAAMGSGVEAKLFYEPDGGGSASAAFALSGLADGLAWIDARQERNDMDRRVGPPPDLQPNRSMVNLVTPIDGGVGQRGLPVNVLAQHYGVAGCEDLDSVLMAKTAPLTERLSDTAVLLAIPCTATGDRVAYRLYIVETGEIGGIQALAFARYGKDYGWTGTDTLIDVEFNEATGELVSRSAGRDVDGCGYAARWRWQGVRFALVEYRYRQTCSGSSDPAGWPVVFALEK